MGHFFDVDWRTMLVPKVALLEIVLRGTVVYLSLFVLLRVVLKRQSGNMAVTDLLVIVLIADAAQNGMANEYKSIPEGILLVATIIFWSCALDWLGFHVPWIAKFIYPAPLELVHKGKILWPNLRKELITLDELQSQLREQGIQDVKEVKTARMEGDGRISVVKADGEQHAKPKDVV